MRTRKIGNSVHRTLQRVQAQGPIIQRAEEKMLGMIRRGYSGEFAPGRIGQDPEDFRTAAWPAPVYLDDEDVFKQALGNPRFSNWWLLKPSVIRGIISGSKYRRHLAPMGIGNPWLGYPNHCMAIRTDNALR